MTKNTIILKESQKERIRKWDLKKRCAKWFLFRPKCMGLVDEHGIDKARWAAGVTPGEIANLALKKHRTKTESEVTLWCLGTLHGSCPPDTR